MKRFVGAPVAAVLFLIVAIVPGRTDEVKIRVLDGKGAPAANATVWVTPFVANSEVLVRSTDATGSLVVDVAPPTTYRSATLGSATVFAPNWALGGVSLKAGENEVRLSKPTTISGTITDPDGKPVEGAIVKPAYGSAPDREGRGFSVGDSSPWEQFFTKTDAAGRWTLASMPQKSRVSYMLFDARFARVNGNVLTGSDAPTEAKTMIARPAATIEGRVVGLDGKPVQNALIIASDGVASYGVGKCDENGAYRIDKLTAGSFTVTYNRLASLDYPASPIEGLQVKEGEVVHAPDIVLREGAWVEGIVTDAQTGAPLAGANVQVAGTSAISGADGQFRARVLPGKTSIYLMILPDGYRQPEGGAGSMRLNVPPEGAKGLEFKLVAGLSLTGTIVDEDGAPITDAQIFVGQQWSKRNAEIGANGAFSVKGLSAGEVTLGVEGDWVLKQPKKLTLPQQQPIVVTVRRFVLQSLFGRVVDEEGLPVPGAQVQVNIMARIGNGDTTTTQTLETDKHGEYELQKARPDRKYAVSAKKVGYRFVTGGAVTLEWTVPGENGEMVPNPNPGLHADDTVLEKLSRSLSGIVRGTAGAPVEGAEIYGVGGEDTVRSDSEGKFLLSRLPRGDIEVFVAKGKLFARTLAKDGVLPNIALQPPPALPAPAAGKALLKELLADTQSGYSYTSLASLALSDPDTALQLVSGLKFESQSYAGAMVLLALARANPRRARERIADLLGALPQPLSGYQEIQLANEMAAYEPDEANVIYEREKALLKPISADIKTDTQPALMRLGVGVLGMQLKIEGAETLVDESVGAYLKLPEDSNSWYNFSNIGSVAASGGGAAFERMLSLVPPDRRVGLLGRGIPVLARRDLPAAVRLMDTILALPEPKNSQISNNQPDYVFGSTAVAVIRWLGKTDPAAALALARRVTSESYKANALSLAATFQPKEAAAALLREAFAMKSNYGDSSRMVVATRAALIDADLGEELLQQVEKQALDSDVGQRGYAWNQSTAQLAYAYSPILPGHARFLLERDAARNPKKDSWSRAPYVLAMGRIDFQRANEMARSGAVNDRTGIAAKSFLLGLLAQDILLPQPMRASASLETLQNGASRWFEGEE